MRYVSLPRSMEAMRGSCSVAMIRGDVSNTWAFFSVSRGKTDVSIGGWDISASGEGVFFKNERVNRTDPVMKRTTKRMLKMNVRF